MSPPRQKSSSPAPIVVNCSREDLDDLLGREWLRVNSLGAYASSTVVGCNIGRIVALASVLEDVTVGPKRFELGVNEFPGAFAPNGVRLLKEFRDDLAATFVFDLDTAELTKEVLLSHADNAVGVRYTLRGGPAELRLRPFAALRDYHALRSADEGSLRFELTSDGAVIRERDSSGTPLFLRVDHGRFDPDAQWWHRFRYRADLARGQDGHEDLYSPGWFVGRLEDGRSCQLTAGLGRPVNVDFDALLKERARRRRALVGALPEDADEASRRLAAASESFVVRRDLPRVPAPLTIVAGFHWFGDWGRDAFIALPGLLLVTKRFAQARQVFSTFARYISNGMIPNCFDQRDGPPHYNSIDASLWFIVAAERYMRATGDDAFWRETLFPTCRSILTAYEEGARFGIRADADGLLAGGSERTQLTWMDAALGGEVITARHGLPVEVNALWYSAHRILAGRCRRIDHAFAQRSDERAELIGRAFRKTFWNEQQQCLYDCIADGRADASIRPNQILAVSLPHSPLTLDQQRAVVARVERDLLTPMGLRTLSPEDSRYCPRYEGGWDQRDRAYHQGTVWAWLMGPFVEAYLKLYGGDASARDRLRNWLAAFDAHLRQAGLGFVGEIFDGDPPHTPRGCIAQAWSVAEVLRARMLLLDCERTRSALRE